MGGNGAIMEDIITNFELVGTRLLRICPTCGTLQDKPYELAQEQAVLREGCPNCGFHFPVATETHSTAVFKDLLGPADETLNGAVDLEEVIEPSS